MYIDEPWLLMRWESAHQCVFLEWKAFATSKEFQRALTMALEIVRARQAANLVTDAREMELVSGEDQRWIRYTWAPLAIAAGLKRIAVVEAKQGLAKFGIDAMFSGRRTTGVQMDSRTFESLADAMTWVDGARDRA